MERGHALPHVDVAALPLAEEVELRLDRGEHLVHRLHLVEVTGGGAGPAGLRRAALPVIPGQKHICRAGAAHGVDAVVDRQQHRVGDVEIALRAGAAGLRPLIAADARLHAAVQTVVAGVLQRDAAGHQRLDDDLVGLEGGHAAGALRAFDGGLPERARRAGVDAQGLRRVVQHKAAGGLEHHIGDRVRGVVAGAVHAAQRHELAGGVAGAGLRRALGPDLVALGHLEVEAVEDLLRALRRQRAGGDVLLVVAAQVLVHAPVADAVHLPVHAHGELVEIDALHRVVEVAAGVFHDPVQAVGHLQQLPPARRVAAFLRLARALRGVALGPVDDALAHDGDGAVEVILVVAVAEDAVFLQLGHLLFGLALNGAEALLRRGPEVGREVAHRGLAVVLRAEEQHAVAGHAVTVVAGHVLVHDGGHGVFVPEVAGGEQVSFVLGVDVIGVLLALRDGPGAQLLHKPVEAGLGVERAAAVARALPADDDLVVAHEDGHVLKEVAQVLRALEDARELRVLHIKLRHEPVTIDVDARAGAAVSLADALYALGDRFPFKHGGIPPLLFRHRPARQPRRETGDSIIIPQLSGGCKGGAGRSLFS